jgi:hypothetical protein
MLSRIAHAVVLWLICGVALAAPSQRVWYSLSANGVRTGYAYSERDTTPNGTVEREAIHLEVHQAWRRSSVEQRIEFIRSADGAPASIQYSLASGTVRTSWRGTIDGGKIHFRSSGPDRQRDFTLDLPASSAFPPELPLRLAQMLHERQTSISYLLFDPGTQAIVPYSAVVVSDAGDAAGAFSHVRVTRGASEQKSLEDFWFDADGSIRRRQTVAYGVPILWQRCAVACDARIESPMDPMDALIVRSPVHIMPSVRDRTLRFVISRSDGEKPLLMQSTEQQTVFDGETAVVTVCRNCGPPDRPEAPELARYLKPNRWVRSDDAEIRALALNTVMRGASVDARMRKLTEFVRRRMRGSVDFLGYADAVTALHEGSGDCTEFAVLLAALARAQEIPARVVVGLAYSDRFSGRKDVFSPHTWVQAWTGGRWKSYDAALDDFDSTHIAFAAGSGDPGEMMREAAQLAALRIEKAGVVR